MIDFAGLPKDYCVTAAQFTKTVHTTVYPAVDPINNPLHGKTVVVTGASRGLGAKGIVPAFVQAGVSGIVLLATNATKLAEVETEVKKMNPEIKTLALSVDIADGKQVATAWTKINETFARVEILVNNAGVESTDGEQTHQLDPDVFWRNFEVNVKGTHIMTHAFLNAALPWCTPANSARLINVSSGSAWFTWPFLAAYTNSKASQTYYTATVAASYPEGNVLAYAINPGFNDTDMAPSYMRNAGFDTNDPLLTGANLVWLVADPGRSKFLSGRMISVEWDVEELLEREEEIVSKDLLKMQFNAVLGPEQFKQ